MSRKSTSRLLSPPSKTSNSNPIGNEDGWTDDLTNELLEKMKKMLPRPDTSKYKTSLEKFDWSKLIVGKYSGDECKKQWYRVYKKLRKFKTLTDLVLDSIEHIANPYKGNKKKHPDHPKRPLTPYFRFFLCEREKYAAANKQLTNLQITSILSKKYREISVEEKEKYLNEWKEEMIQYRVKLEQFKHDHPEYYDKDPPRMSRTPLQIFNQENVESFTTTKSKKKLTKKQIQESLKKKYQGLEDDQKLPYILKAIEEWEKYKEELEMFKKSHPDVTLSAAQTKSTLTVNDWKIHDKSLGKPDRPPANGYNLFCTRMMVSDAMKHMTSRDRIMQCGQKWQILTTAEKEAYQAEFVSLRDNYRSDMKNFLKSLTPRQREEYLERAQEIENKKNSKRKAPVLVKEEVLNEEDFPDEEEEEELETDDESSSDSDSTSTSSDEEEVSTSPRKKKKTPAAKVTSSAPLRPTTPISALFLYQKAHKEKYAAKHPNLGPSDVALMLARRYNNLPQEKKAKYMQKEIEERALRTMQMRKNQHGEVESPKKDISGELKAVTGEQIFQEQNKSSYLKKGNGSAEKAEELMRKAWTSMNKERRKKYIGIAHEQNAKNIAEHQAAKTAAKDGKRKKAVEEPVPENNLSQKEIKSYLALEPKKVPKDGFILFKLEQKVRLNHLTPAARTKELNRLWSVLPTANKKKYKERAETGMNEYNKKLQRWIKSLPPQAYQAYQTALQKREKNADSNENDMVANGTKKRKAEGLKSGKDAKKLKKEESDSSDDSSDDSSSSSSSDDDSDSSSSSDSSSDESDSEGSNERKAKVTKGSGKKPQSSDDSSSSSSDDSDSD